VPAEKKRQGLKYMVRTLIQITALILTVEAAYFLLQGNLGLSPNDIAKVASTKYGSNSEIVKSLSKQKGDSWVGFALLLSAFLLQLINSFWEMRWTDFSVSKCGIILSIFIGIIIFIGCRFVSKGITEKTQIEVESILKKGS
jgi:hypothetical protein